MRPRGLGKLFALLLSLALAAGSIAVSAPAHAATLEGGGATSGAVADALTVGTAGAAADGIVRLEDPADSGASKASLPGLVELGDAPVESAEATEGEATRSRAVLRATSVNTIDRSSKDAVADAYTNVLLPALAVLPTWSGSMSGCVPAAEDAATHDATLTAINYFRRMAGLGEVTESTAASAVARQTALMMIAQGALSHYPGQDWACWTNNGAYAASLSNLSLGRLGAASVQGQIDDFGTNNVGAVGHRRWLLSPGQQEVGVASTTAVNGTYFGSAAIVVMSPSSSTCSGNACDGTKWQSDAGDTAFTIAHNITWSSPTFVQWPSAGYFPYQLLDDRGTAAGDGFQWTVATGNSSISFSQAVVSMTKNGVSVGAISASPQSGGKGDRGAISWLLPAGVMTQPAAGQTDVYSVTISGITGYGTLTYEVKVFSVPEVTFNLAPWGYSWVGGEISAITSDVTPANATLTYQWTRDGEAIPGATNYTYTVQAADLTKRIRVQVTGAAAGYAPRTATSGYFEIRDYFWTVATTICTAPKVGVACWASLPTAYPPPDSVDYQWFVGDSTTVAGVAQSYTPVAADAGKTLTVRMTLNKAGYQTTSVNTVSEGAIANGDLSSATAAVCASPKVGVACAASASATPAGASVTYVWKVAGQQVSTASSYTPTAADAGKALTVTATFKLAGYNDKTADSTAKTIANGDLGLGTPTITGTTQVGSTLTAVTGTWSPTGVTFTYQWLRDGSTITGATSSTYKLVAADSGTKVSIRVTGSLTGYTT
ncbi:MAG: CAP domain-containing protein, partial [Bifidobacteriaceae bacterium]|nr:CAP domain-containing protein [Bifidobacteriaceae bacterium]